MGRRNLTHFNYLKNIPSFGCDDWLFYLLLVFIWKFHHNPCTCTIYVGDKMDKFLLHLGHVHVCTFSRRSRVASCRQSVPILSRHHTPPQNSCSFIRSFVRSFISLSISSFPFLSNKLFFIRPFHLSHKHHYRHHEMAPLPIVIERMTKCFHSILSKNYLSFSFLNCTIEQQVSNGQYSLLSTLVVVSSGVIWCKYWGTKEWRLRLCVQVYNNKCVYE